MWFVVGLLGLVELFVLARIRVALFDGAVPLNPAGWLGYAEYLGITVERQDFARDLLVHPFAGDRAGAALRPVHLSGRDPHCHLARLIPSPRPARAPGGAAGAAATGTAPPPG